MTYGWKTITGTNKLITTTSENFAPGLYVGEFDAPDAQASGSYTFSGFTGSTLLITVYCFGASRQAFTINNVTKTVSWQRQSTPGGTDVHVMVYGV